NAGDGREAQADPEHQEAWPEILPQLSALDHVDSGEGDLARRREQDRVDVRSDPLPERKRGGERGDADRQIEQLAAIPAVSGGALGTGLVVGGIAPGGL